MPDNHGSRRSGKVEVLGENMSAKDIKFNLNEREQERFCKVAQSCIKTLEKIIEAIEQKNDNALGLGIIMFTVERSVFGKDLVDLMKSAIANSEKETSDFPDVIGA